MATLNLFFVRYFDQEAESFGEGWQYALSMTLVGYFNSCLAKTSFNNVDYWWGAGPQKVSAFDFVCYMQKDSSKSIVARAYPQYSQIVSTVGGATIQLPSQAVVTEIYMDKCRGDAKRHLLIANLIFHEFMHNVLDATSTLIDVHNVKDGTIGRDTLKNPLKSSEVPSPADFAAMNQGLKRKHLIVQHTGDMF